MNMMTNIFKCIKSSQSPTARSLFCILPVLLILTGCEQGADLPTLAAPTDSAYHLGSGDHIRIITYDETQLSNEFIVAEDGTIAFPLIGSQTASGKTPAELADNIASSLKEAKLIDAPSVSVEVILYRPISVLGEVNNPGQYPYQPGMTMLDAVALAGGFTYRAVTGYAADWRNGGPENTEATEGKIAPNSELEPGDVIKIFERYF